MRKRGRGRWLAAAAVLLAGPGVAGARGQGSGAPASTVTTKSLGAGAERAEEPSHDHLIQPRHGLLGAPGAAMDAAGPSRLGPRAQWTERPDFGEAAGGGAGGEADQAWRSGDRVRSASSADVRQARQQQAPDLEWAGGSGGDPRLQPQTPYGVQTSAPERQRPRR